MNAGAGTLRTLMIVLGSSWLGFALTILRVLVLPAKLGDTGLGQVTLAVSFTTFFGIFTSLGTSVYLVRAIAQDHSRADRYLSNALLLRAVMGLLVLGVMIAAGHIAGYAPETRTIILIVACATVISTVSNVFESGLQGLGQMGWRAMAMTSGQVTATCVGVALLLSGASPLLYALCIPLGAIVELALVLMYFALQHPIRFLPDRAVMTALLIGGLPLFLWGVLQTAYGQIDATILSLFAGEHVVGWFGAASQITNVLIVIPTAITAVTMPVLCTLYVQPGPEFDRLAARVLGITLLILAPVGAGLAIAAPDVLRLLPYPAAFRQATPALALLALAVPVTGMLMVLSSLAVAIGQERAWLKISAFAVCVFPPLYVGFIWWFQAHQANGATGAALANLIGETALVAWAWRVLPPRVRQSTFLRQAPQIAMLTLLMIGAVGLLQRVGVPILAYVPVGAIVYGLGAGLARLVTRGDLAQVRRALVPRRSRGDAEAVTP
ncbi:MAG TPA: flippase [Chloroflexia bacterium]|nr:flippase [Chloroflexia bacterium]